MSNEACKVCGNTDMNLIDGFYYCVECGTQDTNIMETIVEERELEDGTLAIRQKRKINTIARVLDKVSPEWHKWQCRNYILSGMVKEMMDLGVGPKFKMRVMWLWTLYVKRFQNKEELGLTSEAEEPIKNDILYNRVFKKPVKSTTKIGSRDNISHFSGHLFVTIILLALNFDRSDILASDLIRYIREGRLSYYNSIKFIPKEIDSSSLSRVLGLGPPNELYYNTQAMTFLKTLNLGGPIVPNLRKIVDRYVKELCLPNGFKDLVFSLMNLVPCDYLQLDEFIMKHTINIPFYGGRVMAYILVALKMCFGLDGEYENELSDAVDRINNENCHMKCYKLGVFSTSSDRLFSFREWVKFLQLRKLVLCRSYVPMSVLYHIEVDDYVYMEQRDVKEPYRKQPSVTDEITMNLLEKIRTEPRKEVIPKKLFQPTLTPFTDYTDVLIKHYHDPEIRLLLSEDFTQYSLKYATESLDLRTSSDSKNIIVGVKETSKCMSSKIITAVNDVYVKRDSSLVFIRNCENKHWMKTKRPKVKHVKKLNKEHNDSDDDHFSSNDDTSDSDTDNISETDESEEKKLELIEEDKSNNIFEDDFQNLHEYGPKSNIESIDIKEEPIDEEHVEHHSHNGSNSSMHAGNSVANQNDVLFVPEDDILQFFNPETFDREDTIKHLILLACNDYKIPIPNEFRTNENKEPRKRKIDNVNKEHDNNNEGVVGEKKTKTRAKPGEAREKVNILLSAYYDCLRHDVFSSVRHHVRDLVEKIQGTQEDSTVENEVDGGFNTNLENFQHKINEYDNTNTGTINDPNRINYTNNMVDPSLEITNQTLDETGDQHSVDNTNYLDDPSLIEIQNQTLDESVVAETENANKGDPTFNDKIYDVKQLYLKTEDDNFEDIFNISNDPDVDKILSKKIKEEQMCEPQTKIDNKKEDGFLDWDDNISLKQIKELMLEQKKVSVDAYRNLKYLVSNRKKIPKFNYWVRHDGLLKRVNQRVDSFTNKMKEVYPKSFCFVIMECAAMLDITPFLLYKYMAQIEESLITE